MMGGHRTWTEAKLPFNDLSPIDFERLCCALLAAEGHSEIRHWGAAGAEGGCDLVSVDGQGRRQITQCKRVQNFGPADAKKEIRSFLKKPPSPPPEVYGLIATCALSRATEETLEEVVTGAFSVELCGASELDLRVRRHLDLVEWFFGPANRAAVEPPLWWIGAAPLDRPWAEPFAQDLQAILREVRPDARVELGIPSDKTPWPEIPPRARWGLVVVTPEALADPHLRQLWQGSLCQPCSGGGDRRRLALSLTTTPWPPWLKERFERLDLGHEADPYRIDLSTIVSKYIGLTEKDSLPDLEGPGERRWQTGADLRQDLVEWLEPRMQDKKDGRFWATALGLEGKSLDDFESPALRASAALALAMGTDEPAAGARRVIRIVLKDADDESPERLQALRDLEERFSEVKAPHGESTSLLALWLRKVSTDHRRLVDHFQQTHELDLLDRVVVELELTAEPLPSPEDLEERSPRERRFSLRELLEMDPERTAWVTRRWILRGDPGAGKTTLLRHLAATLAAGESPRWIPVFQSLPVMLRDGRRLLDRLEDALGTERRGLGQVLDHLGEEGRLLLLLDGLDEVDPEAREKAEETIRQLATRWPQTPIVVTTRPIGYRRFAGDFRELQLQALDRPRRREFLARWFGRFEGTLEEERADNALRELDHPGFEELAAIPSTSPSWPCCSKTTNPPPATVPPCMARCSSCCSTASTSCGTAGAASRRSTDRPWYTRSCDC